ncbi:hypothetical protein [Simkania sp.]|uniref:hypothetical protein n=1 Tax=Simkania sp. TaxID=34094 RepID=UPI003B52AB18
MSIQLNSKQKSFQDQSLLEFACRAGVYAASGLVASRFTPLTPMEGIVTSLTNGLSVQLGHIVAKTDDIVTQKLLLSMVFLGLSTALMSALSGRIIVNLDYSAAVSLFLFNAAGELVKTLVTNFLSFSIPQKEEDVKNLSETTIKKLHTDYATLKSQIGEEALPAVHARFYELALPLPKGKSFKKMIEEGELKITELTLPDTCEKVDKLKEDQMPWIALSIAQHPESMKKLSFPVGLALGAKMVRCGFSIK